MGTIFSMSENAAEKRLKKYAFPARGLTGHTIGSISVHLKHILQRMHQSRLVRGCQHCFMRIMLIGCELK